MNEYVINLHMHTTYSDGRGTHAEIAAAAQRAGIDAVIVSDHNVLVKGIQKYYESSDGRVLLMVGEVYPNTMIVPSINTSNHL